jgi:NADH-quinone oxidoreductase subunit J
METILFVVFSVVAVSGGVLTITRRSPLASALSLAATLLAVAGLYSLLQAPFLAIMQVFIYAGAILVLVIFVIMLLNLPDEAHEQERIGRARGCFGIVLGAALFVILYRAIHSLEMEISETVPEGFGTIEAVGDALFTRYLYPFEIVSVLLLVAIIGAVLIAKRHLD